MFTLIFNSLLLSQNYPVRFEHFSIAEGLSEVNVLCILQDKNGFLWVGTQDGLNRFDGYNFTVFKRDRRDKNSISGNYISCLLEDKNGKMWIGTTEGLNRFNQDGKFTRFKLQKQENDYYGGLNISTLFEDRIGNLWIGTHDGDVIKFEKTQDQSISISTRSNNVHHAGAASVNKIIEDKSGAIWIATNGEGLFKISKNSGKEKLVKIGQNPFHPKIIHDLSEESDGNIFVASSQGIYMLYPDENKIERCYSITLEGLEVNTIYRDKENNLWIGTLLDGLFLFDSQRRFVRNFRENYADRLSISNNGIFSICEDNNRIIWIGTGKGGLNKLDKKNNPFHTVTKSSHGISNNQIGAVIEDMNGDLWIGTDNGLNKLEFKTGKVTLYANEIGSINSIGNNRIRALMEDETGNIWIGTRTGLSKYDPIKNKFTNYLYDPGDNKSIPFDVLRYIVCDKNNIMWIGTTGGGLIKFIPDKNLFTRYSYNRADNTSISNNYLTHIVQDKYGNFWICGRNLFNKFIPAEEKFERFLTEDDDNIPSTFYCIHIVSDEELWLGSDGGLVKYNPVSKRYEIYGEEDGLANNNVFAILPDGENNLWLSTNKGISRFLRKTETFINYNVSNGIACDEFNVCAFFRGKSGKFYFGGTDGLTYFYPDSIKINVKVPSIVITDFNVFNKPIHGNMFFRDGDIINLDHKQNFISFQIAALDFTQPAKILYAYKLIGVDKDWIYPGGRRYASYTELAPGEYTLQLKTTNSDGLWNEKGIAVGINILPPYWETWWFRTLAVIIFISFIFYIYQIRVKILKKEKTSQQRFSARLIESQEKERARIASELHDSIGQNLILIKNRALLGMGINETESATEHFSQISDLSSQTISDIREISYNLRPYQLGKLGLTKTISSIFNQVKKGTEIDFSFEIDNIDKTLEPENEIHFFRIVQECLNNTIKHSGAHHVKLIIKTDNEKIRLDFSDDGRGFESAKISDINGMGFLDLTERINILKGSFNLMSEPGQGVRINISIPIARFENAG